VAQQVLTTRAPATNAFAARQQARRRSGNLDPYAAAPVIIDDTVFAASAVLATAAAAAATATATASAAAAAAAAAALLPLQPALPLLPALLPLVPPPLAPTPLPPTGPVARTAALHDQLLEHFPARYEVTGNPERLRAFITNRLSRQMPAMVPGGVTGPVVYARKVGTTVEGVASILLVFLPSHFCCLSSLVLFFFLLCVCVSV
jgi:hypothetical protein